MGESFTLKPEAESGDKSDWVAIPDNTFLEAEVLNIKTVTKPFTDKETGEPVQRVEWEFKVTDESSEFKGRRVKGETSTNFTKHPDCRMFMWVQEILGTTDLPDNFNFNTEDVIGASCIVLVGLKEKPRKDGKGIWSDNSVKDVQRAADTPVTVGGGTAYSDVDMNEPF